MTRAETIRNTALALLGALGLVLKPAYRGPLQDLVYAYGGNFSVSLGLYFAALSAASRHGFGRLAAAAATLAAVEAFELANGFGIMANVYDPIDLLANAIGVAVAMVIDLASARLLVQSARSAALG